MLCLKIASIMNPNELRREKKPFYVGSGFIICLTILGVTPSRAPERDLIFGGDSI